MTPNQRGSPIYSSCTKCKTLIPLGESRCTRHRPKRTHVLSSTQRGYDAEYLRNRATILEGSPLCVLCNRRIATTADHIIPLSRGGTNQIHNLRPACPRCNSGRGNRL
ncbi:HNH endonuclease [Micromonospora salmantinae]|uniref:HNH endonuclease n=1 Tax=Micromonospora salmantinae TaxID=2911211 RepID=UPI0035560569